MNMRLTLMLSMVLSLLLLSTTAAVADPSTETGSVEKNGEAMLEELVELNEQISSYRSDLKQTKGEAQSALFVKMVSGTEELGLKMDGLLQLLMDQKSGQEELKTRFGEFVTEHTKTLLQDIELATKALSELNQRDQNELSVEEVEDLSRSVKAANLYLDGLYSEVHECIERQNTLELEHATEIEMLQKLLAERAERLVGHVELSWRKVTYLKDRIASLPASEPGGRAEQLQNGLFILEDRQQGVTNSLATMVDLMDEYGLETSTYRLALIQVTGNFSDHIFDRQVFLGLMERLYQKSIDWLKDSGPAILLNVIIILLVLLVFKVIASLAGRVVRKALSKSQLSLSTLLQDFFVSMASKAVMVIGFLIILSQLGVEIGPALAGLGVVGFIVGFALQETLSNFASGLMILIYRPFDVGDLVEVAGNTGRVRLMSLVSTTIVTLDNQRLVVPNTKIWGDVIRNVTAEDKRRIDMVFGIGYEDDIAAAEKIMKDIVSSHPLVLKQPEPDIKLHTLGESSLDFVVRPWVRTDDYWTVYWDVTRAIKEHFDKQEISIPYPQRDVHMYQIPANPQPVEPTRKV